MGDLRSRVIVVVALTLSASACAAILGIDDVNLKDAGESGTDASSDAASDGSIADAGNDAEPLKEYSAEVLDDLPVGYWRLADPNINAANIGGGTGSGTYGETITHTTDGGLIVDPKNNEAAIFPGLPDGSVQLQGVSISKDSLFEHNGSTLTIEAWVEPLAESGDIRTAELVSYGSSVFGPFEEWALRSVPPVATFYTSCCGQVMTATLLRKGFIYHLVATFDHGAQLMYVNGEPDGEPGGGGDGLVFDASPDGLGIGATWAGYNPFNGILDEVAVYDHVLTPDHIRRHYQAGRRPQ